jgi:hypothetical protein
VEVSISGCGVAAGFLATAQPSCSHKYQWPQAKEYPSGLQPLTACKRVEFSKTMLALKPKKEDWRDLRFSDEVHCSIELEGRLEIIRKPGERYCSDCIQETMNQDHEKELERSHSWAAVGYNFKSDMHFYKVPGNKNGKLSLNVYRNQILEPIIKLWLERGDSFILEKDNDSGYGSGSSSDMAANWKHKLGLDSYFNCSNSPNLAPIENCWQLSKQYLKRFPHWNEFETQKLAHEAWQNISQKFINKRVDSMPQRLQDCIETCKGIDSNSHTNDGMQKTDQEMPGE